MYEFDVSNNRFVGPFPSVVLEFSDVKYLDLRYNNFEGHLLEELFEKELDTLFLNDNKFTSNIPENFGNFPGLSGCFFQQQLHWLHS